MLENVAKEILCTIRRQVGENNDDDLVDRVVAVSRASVQEQALVAVHELDGSWRVPVGEPRWSKPECLTF